MHDANTIVHDGYGNTRASREVKGNRMGTVGSG